MGANEAQNLPRDERGFEASRQIGDIGSAPSVQPLADAREKAIEKNFCSLCRVTY